MEVTDKEGNNGECLFLILPQLSGQASVCEAANTLGKAQVHKNRFTGNLFKCTGNQKTDPGI